MSTEAADELETADEKAERVASMNAEEADVAETSEDKGERKPFFPT